MSALRATYEWCERHSGWAPPDEDTLADWAADGLCRCPDDCLVELGRTCRHGLVTWARVLADLEEGGHGARPTPTTSFEKS